MSNVAVIPARGGSTRVPRKNIRKIGGLPLIAHSIVKAQKSALFQRIVVTTDDDEIAAVAREYGADVPFKRSPKLSDNYATSYQALADAYEKIRHDDDYEVIACLYATAPLMSVDDLKAGYEAFVRYKADYLYACCEFPFPVQRAQYVDADLTPHPFMPDCMPMRSQDLTKAYQDAAQFYFFSPRSFELKGAQRSLMVSKAFPIPRRRVIDIDTEEDFILACAMYEALEKLDAL